MVHRCHNPKRSDYKYYGGRGIRVCDRWRDYDNFLNDMGERPKGLTIDRINVNKGYEPGNCKWSTRVTQSRNQRRVRMNMVAARVIRYMRSKGVKAKRLADAHAINPATVYHIVNGTQWNEE